MNTMFKRRRKWLAPIIAVLGLGLAVDEAAGQIPTCHPPPAGLATWWPFDGDGRDTVGGANMFLFGNAAFAPGRVGQALTFDGTFDYGIAVGSPALNVGPGPGLTAELWIKPDALSTLRPLVEWNSGSGAIGAHLWVSVGGAGTLYANLRDTANGDHLIETPPGVLQTGVWQHVALTYDKSSGVARLHVNGGVAAQMNLGVFTPQTTFPLYAGLRPSGAFSGIYYDGAMDELSLYQRALSAAEVAGIHAAGALGKCPSNSPPFIVAQPQSLSVTQGATATFTVTAMGDAPLNYRWRRNGATVSVGTNSSLVLPAVTSSNAGLYSVVVSNAFGFAVSSNALLTVTAPGSAPVILSILPTNQVVLSGSNALITLNATGSPPLFYQWSRNGVNVSGATNSTIAFTPAIPPNAGTYRCAVSNLFGGVLSTGAVLTVVTGNIPPVIMSITPTNLTVPVGSNVAFTVTAAGTAPLAYQWQFGGVNLPGRTSPTLAFGGAQLTNSGRYRCVVTNLLGTAISPEAVLNVISPTSGPPVITFPPAYTLVNTAAGLSPVLRVTATGAQPLGYHWFLNGPTQPLPGLTTATNILTNAQPAHAGTYTVVVSNHLGMATNLGWSVNVIQSNAPGGLINFTMLTGVTNVFVFDGPDFSNRVRVGSSILAQLYAGSNVSSLLPIGGTAGFAQVGRINGGVRRVSGIQTGQVAQVQVRAWDAAFGSSYEQALENGGRIGHSTVFTVVPQFTGGAGSPLNNLQSFALLPGLPPLITAEPQSLIVTQGMDASFTVGTAGSGPSSFQWRFNGLDIPGADGSTLILPVAQPDRSGDYSVVVANHVGSVTSAVAVLTVIRTNRPPVAQSLGVTFFEDTAAMFTLGAADPDGDPLTYHVGSPAFGTLSGTPPNLIYRPNSNYYGLDSFSFTVSDGQFTSSEAAVLLHVAAVEDFPVAFPVALALDENTSAPVTLMAYDGDGDPLTYAVTAPAHGALSGTPPDLLYTPAPGYHGPDSFTFTVNDGASSEPTSPPATITITVRPVNDVPVPRATVAPLVALTPGNTNWLVLSPNGSNAAVVLDASASTDPDGDALQFFWLEGSVPFGGGVRLTNVFPAGSHTITLLADDGTATASGVFTFTVVSPDEAIEAVLLMIDSSALRENRLRPLRATLKASVASAERGNFNACANQLRAFLHKVRAQVAPHDPALAAELTAACETILRAIDLD